MWCEHWSESESDLGVAEDDPQALNAASPEVALPISEVLVPGLDNHQAADQLQIIIPILYFKYLYLMKF